MTAVAPVDPARRNLDLVAFLVAAALATSWTAGVLSGWAARSVDPWFGDVALAPRSAPGQAAEAFALITHPYVVVVVTVVLAVRSLHQRQRRLALALTIAAAGIALCDALRFAVGRSRPVSEFHDSVSAAGSAYPAGHLVAATVLVWVVVTLANAQRKSARSQWKRRILGALLVGSAGVDQWALGIQHGSDLIGGAFLGTAVATAALWLSGVEAIGRSWQLRGVPPRVGRRAAVIYNPSKVLDLDLFRRRVAFAMARAGWDPPLWIETLLEDAGREMARDALEKQVDLVLVAGGDGTARTVCAALAGTGVPAALVPAGTGNLLGRNLGIPLDEDAALDVALNGRPRAVDLVRWHADGRDEEFAVMAGLGLDAQIMRDVSPVLKRVAGGAAYLVAGMRHLHMSPFRATVTLDGRVVHDGQAVMTLVGNVGRLQGGLPLIPSAAPDDGQLHVLVATGGAGWRGLARLVLGFRRDSPDAPLRRLSGSSVQVRTDRAVAYQLDGDSEGETTSFSADVEARAVLVMAP